MYDTLTSYQYYICPVHTKIFLIPIYKLYNNHHQYGSLFSEIDGSKLSKNDVQYQVDQDKKRSQTTWPHTADAIKQICHERIELFVITIQISNERVRGYKNYAIFVGFTINKGSRQKGCFRKQMSKI